MRSISELLNYSKPFLDLIIEKRPQDLAPELGSIIRSFAENFDEPRELIDSDIFLSRTYITEAYRAILEDIFKVLKEGGTYILYLDVEMGSGKTHLLTLLMHLYYKLPLIGFNLINECARTTLLELEKIGYDREIAKRTVLVAADLRSSRFAHVIRLLKNSLTVAGVSKRIIEEIDKFVDTPSKLGRELAELLDESKNVIVLLDELFYTAIRDLERREAESLKILEFIQNFVEYRRTISDQKKSALIFLVSSAREDFNIWLQISPKYQDKEIVRIVDSILRYLSRTQSGKGTYKWISIDEAFKIIRRWLGITEERALRYLETIIKELEAQAKTVSSSSLSFLEDFKVTVPFSPAVRWIANKVLAPYQESDLPDAQHLRGFIKVAAHLILNALRRGSLLASLNHIDDECIKVLVKGEAPIWLNHLEKCREFLQYFKELPNDIKEMLNDIINIILMKSLTSRKDKLISLMKLSHVKSDYATQKVIDLIAERFDIALALLGSKYDLSKLDKCLNIIDRGYVPYVLKIPISIASKGKVAREGYIFTIYVNPLNLYRMYVRQVVEDYLRRFSDSNKRVEVLDKIDLFIKERLELKPESEKFEIILVDVNGKNVEEIVNQIVDKAKTDLSRIRIIILNTWMLSKEITENIVETLKERLSVVNPINILLTSIIVPVKDDLALRDLVESYAYFEAIESYIKEYLQDPEKIIRELVRGVSEIDRELYRKLLENYQSYVIERIYEDLSEILTRIIPQILRVVLNGSHIIYVDVTSPDLKLIDSVTDIGHISEILKEYLDHIRHLRHYPGGRKTVPVERVCQHISEVRNSISCIALIIYECVRRSLKYVNQPSMIVQEVLNWLKDLERRGFREIELLYSTPYIPRSIRTDKECWRIGLRCLASDYNNKIENINNKEYLIIVEKIVENIGGRKEEIGIRVKLNEVKVESNRENTELSSKTESRSSIFSLSLENVIKGSIMDIVNYLSRNDLTGKSVSIRLNVDREGKSVISIHFNVKDRETQYRLTQILKVLINFVDRENKDNKLAIS
ncbi:MAG: hypothetical protein GXO26_04270 [Crenarchaeota archaeon]|nr:hypothetical protein [Thermoproteota archaeon]